MADLTPLSLLGLPVRQWRKEWVNAVPSPQQEMAQQGDRWAVELPFGMPRESHLLPPHSQELLRAARSGRLYKRPAPTEDEDVDADVDVIKGDKKEWDAPNEGFMVRTWKQVPRNAEVPVVSHLAKRHKNTVTISSKEVSEPASGPTVIRATVRRIDAAGNPYEQTVTMTEGQHVDGEIISTTVVPAPSAPPPELAAPQQATPVRKRPPPPKRKAKGLGRGRKKGKLPLPLPATRSQNALADGASSIKAEAVDADVSLRPPLSRKPTTGHELTTTAPAQGVKTEDAEDSTNQDSEMADVSGIPSEDEEGDGGDGEEDEGEEGDEGGDTPQTDGVNGAAHGQETEDAEMSDAVQPGSAEEPAGSRPATSEEGATAPKVRFQPPALANLGPPNAAMHLTSPRIEGSPLKNVMIQSPTEPSPAVSPPTANVSNSSAAQSGSMTNEHGRDSTAQVTGPAGQGEPFQPGNNATTEQAAGKEPKPAETQTAPVGPSPPAPVPDTTTASTQPQEFSAQTAEQSAPAPASAPQPTAPSTTEPPLPTTTQPQQNDTAQQPAAHPPASPALLPTATEDEDEGLNLLGSLERELDRREGVGNATGAGRNDKGAAALAGAATAGEPAAITPDTAAVQGTAAGKGQAEAETQAQVPPPPDPNAGGAAPTHVPGEHHAPLAQLHAQGGAQSAQGGNAAAAADLPVNGS